jgi:putative hydrolase of the HAD superfamily
MFEKIVTDVFFDLDHTLWDFEKNSSLTFAKILTQNEINIALSDFLEVYVPTNFAFWKLYREEKITKEQLRYQRLKSVFDKLELVVSDEMILKLADEYIQYLSSYNHLFPNTIAILDYLKPKYKLHIITNGFQEIQDKKMRASNIDGYFEHVINSETAGVKKPNPLIFKAGLNHANVAAKNAIMIGDSLEADIIGAKALGIHVLHFNAHNEPHHEVCPIIHDLSEIKTYL